MKRVLPGQGLPIPPFPAHAVDPVFCPSEPEPVGAAIGWEEGEEIIPHFVVQKQLGVGGMGVVYLVQSSAGEQFAVKKVKRILAEDDRFNFLREIWTWIDLPEHPNLVSGRFVRTVGGETAIFADYVEGKSLRTWIEERKLTQLRDLLDAAIQFAWGLHAAHVAGLVHQDVKPANALLTVDGRVRVSDFGLSTLRAALVCGETGNIISQQGVTARTGTAEYRSPEQAAGQRMTPQSDLWSWGVSVLHMLVGEVTWRDGQAAPQVLKKLVRHGASRGRIASPPGLIKVLERCFLPEPTERWPTLAEAADALSMVFRADIGSEYSRTKPNFLPARAAALDYLRWSNTNYNWDDPREYLAEFFEAQRQDPTVARQFLPPSGGSRLSQVLKDLAVYDEALERFKRLDSPRWRARIARLCQEKSIVHRELGDLVEALQLDNQAIGILEEIVEESDLEAAVDLARAFLNKGIVLRELGCDQAAVNVFNDAILQLKVLVYDRGMWQYVNDLAKAFANKANAVEAIGHVAQAVALYDAACQLRIWLYGEKGQEDVLQEHGQTLAYMAVSGHRLGKLRDAVRQLNDAITLFQELRAQRENPRVAYDIALACLNKSAILADLKRHKDALDACDWALVIASRLQYQQQTDCRDLLAAVYFNKAIIYMGWQRPDLALGWSVESLELYRSLVRQEGRVEFKNELSRVQAQHERITGRLHQPGLWARIRRLVGH